MSVQRFSRCSVKKPEIEIISVSYKNEKGSRRFAPPPDRHAAINTVPAPSGQEKGEG